MLCPKPGALEWGQAGLDSCSRHPLCIDLLCDFKEKTRQMPLQVGRGKHKHWKSALRACRERGAQHGLRRESVDDYSDILLYSNCFMGH